MSDTLTKLFDPKKFPFMERPALALRAVAFDFPATPNLERRHDPASAICKELALLV